MPVLLISEYSQSSASKSIARGSCGLPPLPAPEIRREGIAWSGGAGGKPLEIALTFENRTAEPTAPATAGVSVAAFGAFVPWRPLTTVAVPSLPPGGMKTIRRTVPAADLPPDPFPGIESRTRRSPLARLLGSFLPKASGEALETIHFVGNLNVFVSRRAPVERHQRHAVGLRPGHVNAAMFCVGDGHRDQYTFSLGSCEPGWQLEIAGVQWEKPVEFAQECFCLAITPPQDADSGTASVIVRRGSAGKSVPIEFQLEARPGRSRCHFFA
jgi:hypothetical protein